MYTQTSILRTSQSDPFCSLYWIFHYIKCNMLSRSSKWEMGLIHYIEVRHSKVWVYSKKYSKIALSKLYWHMQIHKQRQKVPKYSKLTLVNLKLFFKRCELDTWTPICIVFCLFLLFKTRYLLVSCKLYFKSMIILKHEWCR